MMKKAYVIILALLLVVVGVAGCASGPKNMKWAAAPPMQIDKNKNYEATIKTNYGDIVVELYPKEAPLAVNNFVFLAQQGYYDKVKFHRVVPGFVIQTGDPTGKGTGYPGYYFADELVTRKYVRGTLAMANSGPNTNGSQFFICLADIALPPSYTIFGMVTSGMNVVDKIAAVPCKMGSDGAMSSPTVDVHMNTVTIAVQ
jgi:cyclophilin family peptidyl-prolyl cis-trans isomerase